MNRPQFYFYDPSDFQRFLDELPAKDAQRVVAVMEQIETGGLLLAEKMRLIRKLEKNLYEIRIKQANNIQRIIYFRVEASRYMVTHGFTKKTQKRRDGKLKKVSDCGQFILKGDIYMDDLEKYVAARSATDPAFKAGLGEERLKMRFGVAVWSLRHELKLSQRAFAQLVELPQSTIGRIEAGEVAPTTRTLVKIATKTHRDMTFKFV